MKILSLSSDVKLFEEGSPVVSRQIKYGELTDRIDIVNLTLKSNNFEVKKLLNKVTVYPTGSCCKPLYFWDAYRLAKKLERPDLITVQDPFETGFTALFIAKYFKCPFQVQIHTDFLSPYYAKESLKNKIRILIARFVLPRASCIRVVSERIKRSIQKEMPSVKAPIFVLPIFVDIEKFKSGIIKTDLHKKYPQFKFILIMAARLTREKNISLAVEAVEKVAEKHPDIGLVIVGDGPLRANLKSGKNVIFEGWSSDLASYYKTADLFLNTSNYEGYGMAPVEALASGLPVLMTDVGIAGDIAKDHINGLVIPVNDKIALETAICEFIENESLRQKITTGAKETKIEGDEATYLSHYKQCWENCAG